MRPCVDCGRPYHPRKGVHRCAPHHREWLARKKVRALAGGGADYDAAEWRRTSRRIRKEHVERFGLWCPGFQVPAHRVRTIGDLCADHVQPRNPNQVAVLCRSCNGRKSSEDKRRLGGHVGGGIPAGSRPPLFGPLPSEHRVCEDSER